MSCEQNTIRQSTHRTTTQTKHVEKKKKKEKSYDFERKSAIQLLVALTSANSTKSGKKRKIL